MNSLGNTKQTDPLGPMRHRSHTGLCEGEGGGGKNEVIICLTCSTCVHCHLLKLFGVAFKTRRLRLPRAARDLSVYAENFIEKYNFKLSSFSRADMHINR